VSARGDTAVGRYASALLATAILGAACTAWSAAPLHHGDLAGFLLFLAIVFVAGGVLRLAVGWLPTPENDFFVSAPMRAWIMTQRGLRLFPWEEAATIAFIWLEVLHRSPSWHTAVLGAALVAYLLATHLTESGASASGASARVLRPQARVLALGTCLLALGAAAAMLPAASAGAGSSLLRLLSAIAMVVAAALVLPATS
jgi:hypothetical protein